MSNYDYKSFYRRNLPHIQPSNTPLFVTFRLAGSIPVAVLEQLKELQALEALQRQAIASPAEIERQAYDDQKRAFGRMDRVMDSAANEPYWLADPSVAQMVTDALQYRHPDVYELDTFCIMPNHVHVVFTPVNDSDDRPLPLQTIMHSLKLYTASQANKLLGREGQFWHHENYDHYVRDADEWLRIVAYVLNNPVKAGLVDTWEAWPWSYLRDV